MHDKHSNPIFMQITAADDLNVALTGQEITCKEIVIPEKYYPIKTNLKVSSKKYSYLSLTVSFPLPNSGAIPSPRGHEGHLLCAQSKKLLLSPHLCGQ